MTRVRADVNPCQSNGHYELVAPEISGLDEDILRRKGEGDPSLRQKALEALEDRPTQAIRAED